MLFYELWSAVLKALPLAPVVSKEKCHYKKNNNTNESSLLHIHVHAKKIEQESRSTCRSRWTQSTIKWEFWNSQKKWWH